MQIRVASQESYWQAVLSRDAAYDGTFVFAVKSTGIYCRPSCKARQPKRANVLFFPLSEAAEAAGFRPCKRCQPQALPATPPEIALIQALCEYLCAHLTTPDQITLEALGQHFHFAPDHLHKRFKAAMGITPRQYAEAERVKRLKAELRSEQAVTQAIYQAGFGSSSQVYENTDRYLGMTPGDYQQAGQGLLIHYALLESYLGILLLGMTPRGVCWIGIEAEAATALEALHQEFPQAHLLPGDAALTETLAQILAAVEGQAAWPTLPLDLQATAFQWKVWGALQQIPRGETRTYGQIAAAIQQPNAVRAVARACAQNRAALLIPCHRVIGQNGRLAGYRWGLDRKAQLLEREQH